MKKDVDDYNLEEEESEESARENDKFEESVPEPVAKQPKSETPLYFKVHQ